MKKGAWTVGLLIEAARVVPVGFQLPDAVCLDTVILITPVALQSSIPK